MKKFVFFIMCCIVAADTSGQFRITTRGREDAGNGRSPHFVTDSIVLNGEKIVRQRCTDKELTLCYGNDGRKNNALTALMKLHEALSSAGRYLERKQEIGSLPYVDNEIDIVRNGGFDVSRYVAEKAAYLRLNEQLQLEKRQQELKERQEQAEASKKYLAEQREKERIEDSVQAERDAEQQAYLAEQARQAAAEHKAYERACIKKYGAINGKAIANGKILLGMTRAMCIEAWGEPEVINKTTTKGGLTEKLIYGHPQYVVLKNGRVVTVNDLN